jgi:hypothetical protein
LRPGPPVPIAEFHGEFPAQAPAWFVIGQVLLIYRVARDLSAAC